MFEFKAVFNKGDDMGKFEKNKKFEFEEFYMEELSPEEQEQISGGAPINMVECPYCHKSVPKSLLNAHLKKCNR